MSAPGTIKPVRCADEIITYVSRWEVGASGAHTKDYGKGFASVAKDGSTAGRYVITFTEVPEGPLVDLRITHWSQAGAEAKVCAPVDGSYSASAKTVKYQSHDIDETAALAEVPSGDKISITAVWLKTA